MTSAADKEIIDLVTTEPQARSVLFTSKRTSVDRLSTVAVQKALGIVETTEGPLDWQDRGLCLQTDPEMFYPDVCKTAAQAKKMCRRCDVRQECLDYALENDESVGIRGGLSVAERNKLKRRAA